MGDRPKYEGTDNGGGRVGVGRAIARRLAADGVDSGVAGLAPTAETLIVIEAAGRPLPGVRGGCSQSDLVAALAARDSDAIGRCDIFNLNDGIHLHALVDDTTFEDWKAPGMMKRCRGGHRQPDRNGVAARRRDPRALPHRHRGDD